MKRRTGRFSARGDDGRDYTVEVWTEFLDAGNSEDPYAEVEGLKSLVTGGQRVNWRGQGEYQIVSTGVILRSTDPSAP